MSQYGHISNLQPQGVAYAARQHGAELSKGADLSKGLDGGEEMECLLKWTYILTTARKIYGVLIQ